MVPYSANWLLGLLESIHIGILEITLVSALKQFTEGMH